MMLTHHSPEDTAPSVFQLGLAVVSFSTSLRTCKTSPYISLLFYRYRRTSLGDHVLGSYSQSSARRRCIFIHLVRGTCWHQCRATLGGDTSLVAAAPGSLKPGMACDSQEGAVMLEQEPLLEADHEWHQQEPLKPKLWLGSVAPVDLSEDLEFLAHGCFAAQDGQCSQSCCAGVCCASLLCLKTAWPNCWMAYCIWQTGKQH